MRNARELLDLYVAGNLESAEEAAQLFSEGGAFEVPWLADLGLPASYLGREAIANNFATVRGLFPGFVFGEVEVLVDTPDKIVAQYGFRAISSLTSASVHMKFWAFVHSENGEILLMREVMNMTRAALAVFPEGRIPDLESVARE